ncbi:MAG: TIGR04255 family protein [Chloroflexi bacterium]|nr:TIGR04255 family protein [Chloroflexota bacterium]
MADRINSSKFHFPIDIKLERNSLAEAWLELQWELPQGNIPGFFEDKAYPFALGVFYNNVKNEFGLREELDSINIPEGMLPYIVQYRFRKAPNSWPLLQFGPGIATVNFTEPYSWEMFKSKAMYLQKVLIDSYQDTKLRSRASILRYRNIFPFDFVSNDVLEYFSTHLNTKIELPKTIPGNVGEETFPSSTQLFMSYDLTEPISQGTVRLGTGFQKKIFENKEVRDEILILEIEISSAGSKSFDFTNLELFYNWLESAHSVIHEWYFSIIEGSLFEQYKLEE